MQTDEKLRQILGDYCEKLPDQLASLYDLYNTRKYSSIHPKDIARNLHVELHRMKGAAHCMGYREFGRELSRMDTKISKSLRLHTRGILETLDELEFRIARLDLMLSDITPEKSRLIMHNLVEDWNQQELLEEGRDEEWLDVLRDQRIVLADDDPFIQKILSTYLMDIGVKRVMAVSSGLEVINAASDFRPDIIITDWKMKPVSGLELLQCIRNGGTELAEDTIVVFFTSSRDGRSRMEIECNGADKHLTKPVSPRVVKFALIDILKRRAGVAVEQDARSEVEATS